MTISLYHYDSETLYRVYEANSADKMINAISRLNAAISDVGTTSSIELTKIAIICHPSMCVKSLRLDTDLNYDVWFVIDTQKFGDSVDLIFNDNIVNVSCLNDITYHVLSLNESGELESRRKFEVDDPDAFDDCPYYQESTRFKLGDSPIELFTMYDHSMGVHLIDPEFTGRIERWYPH